MFRWILFPSPEKTEEIVWVIFCELGWNSCLVLSCCVLSSGFRISAVHLNSIDLRRGTPRWQPYNESRSKKGNRLWVEALPLNNHRHGDREVKQSSNCQLRQWSEKRGRERERKRERERGKEEYINRLPVTSLFFQGVRFHSQVYGYLWGLSCLVWHVPRLRQ